MAKRNDRDDNWHLAIVGALTAMIVVIAVAAFTLHKNSPLVAARPQITASQPTITGEADVGTGSERSVEGSREPRARERPFVPLAPGERRGSISAP